MQTVECSHYIAVLSLSVFIRKFIESIGSDFNNMRRIIQINLFIVIEAIYYITHSLVHFIFRLRSCPEQNISVGSPHRFQFFHFTRSLFIDKRRSRNQSWIFVVDICQNLTIVAFIFYYCSSIPLTASLYGWSIRCKLYLASIWCCPGFFRSGFVTVRTTSCPINSGRAAE